MGLVLEHGFPGVSVVKNRPAMQETYFPSLGWADPLEREMATHSSILALEIHGQASWVGYSPGGRERVEVGD